MRDNPQNLNADLIKAISKCTYIALIKLVHPDAGTPYSSHNRAVLVNRYKHNINKLQFLALSWGIVNRQRSWETERREVRKRGLMEWVCFLIQTINVEMFM
jgi:hypothetical protein